MARGEHVPPGYGQNQEIGQGGHHDQEASHMVIAPPGGENHDPHTAAQSTVAAMITGPGRRTGCWSCARAGSGD
jgi:hypothetical protein